MGPAPRHGHGLVLYQRRARHVQPLIKAMNAETADNVGIEIHRILLMENIKKFNLAQKTLMTGRSIKRGH